MANTNVSSGAPRISGYRKSRRHFGPHGRTCSRNDGSADIVALPRVGGLPLDTHRGHRGPREGEDGPMVRRIYTRSITSPEGLGLMAHGDQRVEKAGRLIPIQRGTCLSTPIQKAPPQTRRTKRILSPQRDRLGIQRRTTRYNTSSHRRMVMLIDLHNIIPVDNHQHNHTGRFLLRPPHSHRQSLLPNSTNNSLFLPHNPVEEDRMSQCIRR